MTEKRKEQEIQEQEPAVVEQSPITDTLKNNYMPYAMSVIVSRAIPQIDGFKPSHRKLLYTMYRMGLMKGPRAKSADVVGQTMALNPHGDQAIYETMVRMTRGNGALINPWIDSKGNFGRVYSRDMQYAAYRYTEARLDKSCEAIFSGLEKDAVDFVDNYSGTMKEPVLLPAAFPTILVNANQGIAVGMASNICSFNLAEVCRATRALIDDPDVDLLKYMPAPDFSTGARIVYDEDKMRRIYETGSGSFKMRAVFDIDKKNSRIEITEIPYTTTVEAIIDDITNQVKRGKIKEINDLRDETDLNGLRITIDYKKSADPELLMGKLMTSTALESNFSCNFNVLIDNRPGVYGVRGLLNEWLKWRKGCVRRELRFDIGKKEDQLHILKGLEKILLDIDKAIKIIRNTEKEQDVIPNLMSGFEIDKVQAEAVAEIKLRHLNREYILRKIKDIKDLEADIKRLNRIAKSDKLIFKEIAKQLEDIERKYGRERKSLIIGSDEIIDIDEEELIEDYNVKYYYTRDGYLKKLALTSLRAAGDLKLKDNDVIVQEFDGTNKSELLFFTDRGVVYKFKGYDVPDCKPSEFGEYTPNLLEMEDGETAIAMHVTDEDYPGYLLLGFTDGRMVKISVDSYKTKTNRKMLKNAIYDGAILIGVLPLEKEKTGQDVIMQNDQERMILVDSDLVPYKVTRNSQGIQVMTQRKDHQATWLGFAEDFPVPAGLENFDQEYYRVRTLPSAGRFIKDEDAGVRQLSLTDIIEE